ncbi:exopolysaccharide biosynthesis protein [Thiohalorhabdus methylotrophus]|uniref:Exopolysaccharide biosynthesis protein n=1 Tax=Thiohalorhabdus methylotrophus TaxID=3242694 RepID=A0ABV4TPP4_9GAMM
MRQEPLSLEDLLDRIGDAAAERERVNLDTILDATGRRSFGPLILLSGLITLAPVIGDIPGMPTIMAALVLLTAGQLLFRREHFWLPGWLLKRSVGRQGLCKALRWMRPPARFLDRWTRPRLRRFAQGTALYAIAGVCILIALGMPVMELIPFSANGAGVALTAFGLALIARDGALALFAFLATALTFGLIIYTMV